jgi:hypothetical protein
MASSNGVRGFAVCWLAILLIGGCGKGDWGYLSGTVKLNGQPVGPGTITFEPTDSERAGSFASFGEDGQYTVISAGRKEGARVGEYRVLIQGGSTFGEETVGPRPASKIPARYANPTTSDLKVTIESGSKTVDFDLQPRP